VTTLRIELRRRLEFFTGSDVWTTVPGSQEVPAERCALIISDMWDRHWSRGATERVAAMAPHINQLAHRLRDHGAHIVHAPSETADAYARHPARVGVTELARLDPPTPVRLPEPALPIDDSDGGSDTGETEATAVWTAQHPAIDIDPSDALIDDDHTEIYSVLGHRHITTVLLAGVHTNMCVLGRAFGIRTLVGWHVDTVLVRDLTDAMYNPAMPPHVDHRRGTELVVEHIEKYLCPTTTSTGIHTGATR